MKRFDTQTKKKSRPADLHDVYGDLSFDGLPDHAAQVISCSKKYYFKYEKITRRDRRVAAEQSKAFTLYGSDAKAL